MLASLYQARRNRVFENPIVSKTRYPPMHTRVSCIELELDVAESYADRQGQVHVDEAQCA